MVTTTSTSPGAHAREPRSLALVAYYDGWEQAQRPQNRATYPRELDEHELESWREGYAEGKAQSAGH